MDAPTRTTTASDDAPTARQVRITEAVVRWYLTTHYGTPDDRGVTQAFCDPRRVGAFAVEARGIVERDGAQLFRLLVAVAMFQRRQDEQITRILRGMTAEDAAEVSSLPALLALSDACACDHARSLDGLLARCDLTKTPRTKRGTCRANPRVDCHLKRHTVLLRRYGHFGKVPSSIALTVRESRTPDLSALLATAAEGANSPEARARAMVDALSRAWRVSEKIASMFLSMVWNPDVTPGVVARRDLDWRHFVVIDSNTDAFLATIGYRGYGTYEARRRFLRALSERIDLKRIHPGLRRDNPRIVQQAMYLFMSVANRRAIARDCMHLGATACAACPTPLSRACPARQATRNGRRRLPIVA
ncbi:hypothetical protein [Sorangium sp. So ce1024]|uniref:hypothetical protein n=1 Tax=Sorangium sp. So ce1024 TaxID=3133327 RepID=UPI003EFEE35A